MQERTVHRFEVLECSIEAIVLLREVERKIRQRDRDLAEQIRTAASSAALNLGEADGSQGGNRMERLRTAAGSNSEVRTALRVAAAWGYVEAAEIAAVDGKLDRIAAILYRLNDVRARIAARGG